MAAIPATLASSLAESVAERDRDLLTARVGCPEMLYIVVIQSSNHGARAPIVRINGEAQVRLALLRLMLIGGADPSVFVSIAPSKGVRLFEHWTHRVLSWSHQTFIRGCHFIVAHVAQALRNLLLVPALVECLVDWRRFII